MKNRPAAVVFLVLGTAAFSGAQELSISAGAGSFSATEKAYRQIYGASVPFAVDLWLKSRGPFGLAVGYGRMADSGRAVPAGEDGPEYPVKFSRTSVPVLVFCQFGVAVLDVRLAAGVGVHRFKETWQTVDLLFDGRKVSPRVVLNVRAPLAGRFAVFGAVVFDSVPTGAGSPLADDVDLGGFQFVGGFSVRIF